MTEVLQSINWHGQPMRAAGFTALLGIVWYAGFWMYVLIGEWKDSVGELGFTDGSSQEVILYLISID